MNPSNKKESKYGKYIYKVKNKYRVEKSLNGKNKNFGYYSTLEDAINVRNALIEVNWDESLLDLKKYEKESHGKYGRYISKMKNKFMVIKTIDGKQERFGYYDTLEEAKTRRDYFISNNWDLSLRDFDLRKKDNIYKVSNGYEIYKRIKGEIIYFGFYANYEDAKKAREKYEKNNWNLTPENLDKYLEEKFDEFVYCANNKFYIKKEANSKPIAEFNKACEAIKFRNLCIRYNWDLTKIKEEYKK